jgi:hypothetical protein
MPGGQQIIRNDMTTVTQKQESSEDIDLILLLERALKFFKRFRWVFIIAVLLGIGAAVFLYKSSPKVYKSRMIVHSFVLTNQELIEITDNWSQLLKKKEMTQLSLLFSTPESTLQSLKKIKAEELQQVFTANNPNGFIIDVLVTDNSILDSLQKGMVYAFENSEYIKARLAFKRKNLEELIATTSREIIRLDSTKKIMENILAGKEHTSSSLIMDGSSVNRQLIEMNEKLLAFRETLAFTNAVQVLQSFSKFQKPAGPSLLPRLAICILFFLVLAYIYALIRSVNEQLAIRSGKKNSPTS